MDEKGWTFLLDEAKTRERIKKVNAVANQFTVIHVVRISAGERARS